MRSTHGVAWAAATFMAAALTLTARGESLAAFDGRCILAGCVAPPSNSPDILGRRALPARRLARLGATPDFHHGLLSAQQPPPAGGGGQGDAGRDAAGRGGGAANYPQRPPGDPAVVERGKALYSVNCQFCHGADTRGGDSGPSLLRSQLVQNDQNGEVIAPVVQNGRPPRMPKFDFTPGQIADIATFLHSFRINSRDPARIRPESIVTGDAAAGQAYFTAKCASCHSITGDLKGLAARFSDPRALQQWWLMPGGGGRGGDAPAGATLRPTTATITFRNGPTFDGRLVRIDEFAVVVMEPDGTTRSFRRDGENPNVDVHDPLQPHKALLRVYSDKDIHDVTAYLVKLP